jgi:HTH-type transcriptional regulator/antitoxin HipB
MDLNLAFPEQLSQHLRSLRKARGLTQAQLAARMGVTQSRISAIESDATKLTTEQLFRVLSTLDAGMVLRMADPEPQATSLPIRPKPLEGDTGGQW